MFLLALALNAAAQPAESPPNTDFLAAEVAVGESSSCALSTDGRVRCWGQVGELLTGEPISLPDAVDVAHITVRGPLLELEHRDGRRSTATLDPNPPATEPPPEPTATVAAPGSAPAPPPPVPEEIPGHTCEVLPSGAVQCTGRNEHGQLGDGSPVTAAEPARVVGLSAVTDLSVAANQACAVQHGGLWCWGSYSSEPRRTGDTPDALGTGQYLAGCAGRAEKLSCATSTFGGDWRRDRIGPPLDKPIAAVASDRVNNLCAATTDGLVHCLFSLGQGGNQTQWTKLGGLANMVELASPGNGICGRTRAGAVACWTDERFAGNPDVVSPPARTQRLVMVAGFANVEQLAAGESLLCARQKNGPVACMGALGPDGSWYQADIPLTVNPLQGATDLAANHHHVCAVVDGEVLCFGANGGGQLGHAGPGSADPTPVPLPLPAVRVGVGAEHSCALLQDGTVWCWGQDDRGQLGRGRLLESDEPIDVGGIGPSPPAP